MTGMICRAALIAASLVIAGVALGDSPVPYNPNCTQPPLLVIRLVSQTVDPAGVATYTIRDISNFPIPGCPVTMDFSACGDVRLCTSDVGAGLIIDCNGANRTVQGITDQNGRVQFIIAGAGTGTGPPTFGRCVTVFAGGVPLSNLAATTPDYNGVGGVVSTSGGSPCRSSAARTRAVAPYALSGRGEVGAPRDRPLGARSKRAAC